MHPHDRLAERFQAERPHLRALAYRMLGSSHDADDAVQEAWLRLGHVDPSGVDNLPAWLHTVLARICLDMLRARKTRREDLAGWHAPGGLPEAVSAAARPEDEALLADSVSRALLVVLDTLSPAERVAFVLHDMFAVPFGEIAGILARTPAATKKLASRARGKVRGAPAVPADELDRQRRVVSAFLTAARAGDLVGVLAVLAPDVVRRADPAALPPGGREEVRGARAVADGTVALAARSRLAELALVNGVVGAIIAPRGRLLLAITFVVRVDKIIEYDVVADPERLRRLRLAVLPDVPTAAPEPTGTPQPGNAGSGGCMTTSHD